MTAATETKPARPLTPDQRSDLHCVWTCCKANGGTTRLETKPRALINRGLVCVTFAGSRHAPSRYAMTAAGRALAEAIDAEREAARAARREIARANAANRGHNVVIGG